MTEHAHVSYTNCRVEPPQNPVGATEEVGMSSGLKDSASTHTTVDLREPRDAKAQAELLDELAWCLARFVDGSADEPTMERARRALARCDASTLSW